MYFPTNTMHMFVLPIFSKMRFSHCFCGRLPLLDQSWTVKDTRLPHEEVLLRNVVVKVKTHKGPWVSHAVPPSIV